MIKVSGVSAKRFSYGATGTIRFIVSALEPTKPEGALWVKGQGLTIVLPQDEAVHAPQSKHVEEVPGRRAHPACPTQTCPLNMEGGTEGGALVCGIPGGVQGQQVDPSLQHGLEPQRQGKRDLGWATKADAVRERYSAPRRAEQHTPSREWTGGGVGFLSLLRLLLLAWGGVISW